MRGQDCGRLVLTIRPSRRIRRVGNVETLLTERDCRAESRRIAPISREAGAWQQSALTMKRL